MTRPEVQTIEDLLPLHALGALDGDEAGVVEQAIASDPALRALFDAYREASGGLAATGVVVAPSESVRARLFDDIDAMSRPGRFDRFAPKLAEMYDVTLDKARMFLGWIDDPKRWVPSAFPNIDLIHLPPGPRWLGADCGIVRMPAGFHFPKHGHHGPERTFVLQGKVTDSTGPVLEPGSEMELPAGVEHDFAIDAAEDYIFAVRFYGIYGIELEQK